MMKCYVIPSPKGIDSLTLVERPEPAPGPRQVLVRVHATSPQLPRPDHRRRQLCARRPQARPDPAVGRRGEVVSVGLA